MGNESEMQSILHVRVNTSTALSYLLRSRVFNCWGESAVLCCAVPMPVPVPVPYDIVLVQYSRVPKVLTPRVGW